MKRLLSSVVLMSALIGNSAIAAEVSIFKNDKVISRTQVNIQGARDGRATTTADSIFIDSGSQEIVVNLTTKYTDGRRITNTFRQFNCRQNTAVLIKTLIAGKGQFDHIADATNQLFKLEHDIGALTRQRATSIDSNELVNFTQLTSQPTIQQTVKNICNYRN